MTTRQPFLSLVGVLLLGTFSLACGGTHLDDDIDTVFDFDILPDFSADTAHLHTPYVVGTEVTFYVHADSDESDEEDSWTMESSNPEVLKLSESGGSLARGVAVGEGTTTLRVRDSNGDVLVEEEVSVLRPDRVALVPHGMALVGFPEVVDHASIEVEGTATFEVVYYHGEERLYGNDVLSVGDAPGVSVEPQTTWFFERREWLQVTPHVSGSLGLQLYAGGATLPAFPLEFVPPSASADMALVYSRNLVSAPEEGEQITILARVFDAQGEPIYGGSPTWTLGNVAQTGEGDLFRFDYTAATSKPLRADHAGLSAELNIPGESGYVDSSNNLGCAVTGGHPNSGGSELAWLVGALALVACRRRMARRLAPVVMLTGLLGCANVCEEATDKLDTCFPAGQSSDGDNEGECSAFAECSATCAVDASCSDIEAQHEGRPSPYADCLAACD